MGRPAKQVKGLPIDMEIRITDLVMDYGKFRALDRLTMQIGPGMFGLLGPNGAGKTTFMRCLTTIQRPTAGEIRLGDIDVVKSAGEARRHIGYLPQEFGFYKGLNAYEVLDYIATMKNIPAGRRRHEIEAALEQVNLTSAAGRKVGGYSGGMKQRLGIAQALLGSPDLLVVDEPTAGLDPEERIRFRNLLAQLAATRTVVLSTHIVADVEASCTALAVLRNGKLAFAGSPEQLMAAARGQVWQLAVSPAEYEALSATFRVTASRSLGARVEVRVLAPENPLGSGVPVEPGLEDGYLAVMGGGQRV